jgi:signal transduction histidine kinase
VIRVGDDPAVAVADRGNDRTVPFDAVPDPMAQYTVRRDGDAPVPVVVAVNRAFASAFGGDLQPPVAVREWWNGAALRSTAVTVAELCSSVAAGEPLDTEVVYPATTDGEDGHDGADGLGSPPPRRYRLRTVLTGADTDTDADTTDEALASPATPAAGTDSGYLLLTPVDGPAGEIDPERIASVVSHDLRNPLDVAKARLQAARETGEEEHFDRLAGAHERMEDIIQDVLTLARGERVVTPSVAADLEAVAAAAWDTVDTRDATLQVDADLPTVEADPERLRRLFENLFRNSVEHGRPSGSPTTAAAESDPIEVRVTATSDGFAVADDGVGIPPDERDRVFEPGYTGEDGGTGLGLTIVDRIATAHGWQVTVGEGPAGGARFAFAGPRGDDAVDATERDLDRRDGR